MLGKRWMFLHALVLCEFSKLFWPSLESSLRQYSCDLINIRHFQIVAKPLSLFGWHRISMHRTGEITSLRCTQTSDFIVASLKDYNLHFQRCSPPVSICVTGENTIQKNMRKASLLSPPLLQSMTYWFLPQFQFKLPVFSHLGFDSGGFPAGERQVTVGSKWHLSVWLQRQRGFCCVCDELHPTSDRSCSPSYCPASHFFPPFMQTHSHNHTLPLQKWQGAYKSSLCGFGVVL